MKLRQFARTLIPRAIGQFLSMNARFRREQQDILLRNSAEIDPSAIIGDSAIINNYLKRPEAISIGPLSAIHGHLLVMPQGGRIKMGSKSLVGPGTRVWSAVSIEIGSYVMISHNVNIHDNISHSLSWEERRREIDLVYPHLTLTDHSFDLKAKPIVIEDDAWIGFNASIMRGVRIGRGAIIGANTIVTKNIEPFTVVAGNPMRIIRRLDVTEEVLTTS